MAHPTHNPTIQRYSIQLVLIVFSIIIAGTLTSSDANAQRVGHNKSIKTRQISSRSNANNACYVLYQKRTKGQNRNVISAGSRRQKKVRPMPETEQAKSM